LEDIEREIEGRITGDTGALLLIPTGRKPFVLALLRAMHRVGARYGIPLFVRQLGNPRQSGPYTTCLWPALTGGDLPLLRAAKESLKSLELDVAWRLLEASAIDLEVTDKAQRLANAFASRPSERHIDPASDPNRDAWSKGLITQRLELINAVCAETAGPRDQIRLIVLAADILEASIAASDPNRKGGKSSDKWKKFLKLLDEGAKSHADPRERSARILLLLREARNKAPVTHGTKSDLRGMMADVVDRLARNWRLSDKEKSTVSRDVPTLLKEAVNAAADYGFGQPGQANSLLQQRNEIIEAIDGAIAQRNSWKAS